MKATNNAINPKHIHITGAGVYADPCRIIPDELWSEYCQTVTGETFEWQDREFRGIKFSVKRTDGDGYFQGVPVDSGTIALFPHSVLIRDFFA